MHELASGDDAVVDMGAKGKNDDNVRAMRLVLVHQGLRGIDTNWTRAMVR